MSATLSSRTRLRLVRAVLAGMLVATGIGLGAFNAWWVALSFGVPLVFLGIAISPRASRVSELPEFRRGVTRDAPQIEVGALTRSSLGAEDMQPTMVTATVNPPNDTAYEARWITSMSKGHFQALASSPFTTLPPDQLPPRDQTDTPEFDDHPGRWAVIYPAVTLVTAVALLFGVAESWTISVPSMPSFGSAVDIDDADDAEATLAERHQRLLDEIVDYLGPGATRNLLRLSYNLDSTSDQAIVFDPTNGRATNINVWDGGSNASATRTMDRADKTFDAASINPGSLGDIVGSMHAEVTPIVPDAQLDGFEIRRPAANEPVVLTGSFDPGDAFIHDVEIEARSDGTVATFFDPADFDTAFAVGRAALPLAGIAPNAAALDQFVIRGIADNTPIISASSIQNSGGVLMQYRTSTSDGQIVIVPGKFPAVSGVEGSYRPDGFSFDAISPRLFDRVRDDAMKRGSVPDYDHGAVAIDVIEPHLRDDTAFVIRIEMARVDASKGMYSLDGQFIKAAHY
ncbi:MULTISPECIES: hypothetical protein [Gordonia]|nr:MULTISPECIES: hypothetical protein [Gordonia]ETA05386.1 hypothetical protein V525_18065 [Gordonia alkanivorans CGMCC 6845]MDH3006944.1 hypothetical protein [Gordonia alkanivorans]MDH3011858.1 hypothetical protein [Gordonia alkanivorans]MDH3016434.1 hypothetical protein [Gordonia alkanivorans]MDH3020463.1 hypothetical protein [Gordonia alkanivorans]